MKTLLLFAVVISSPAFAFDRPAPTPSRYGYTLKFDNKSLPEGVSIRVVQAGPSTRYFIKNTGKIPLIINERRSNGRLVSGAKLVAGQVMHFFPNGVPMAGKRHLKGWQAPFGVIRETILSIPTPKKIYEGRKPNLPRALPKAETLSIPANFDGKKVELKAAVTYSLNAAYDEYYKKKKGK